MRGLLVLGGLERVVLPEPAEAEVSAASLVVDMMAVEKGCSYAAVEASTYSVLVLCVRNGPLLKPLLRLQENHQHLVSEVFSGHVRGQDAISACMAWSICTLFCLKPSHANKALETAITQLLANLAKTKPPDDVAQQEQPRP